MRVWEVSRENNICASITSLESLEKQVLILTVSLKLAEVVGLKFGFQYVSRINEKQAEEEAG